jgi:hypothetical protein
MPFGLGFVWCGGVDDGSRKYRFRFLWNQMMFKESSRVCRNLFQIPLWNNHQPVNKLYQSHLCLGELSAGAFMRSQSDDHQAILRAVMVEQKFQKRS